MQKYLSLNVIIFFCCVLFISCNSATPEKYFGVAVLNSNMQFGFAGDGFLRQLESPSVKMSETSSQPVPMQRSEVINQKIQFTEEALAKLKELKETPDTKDILQNALALYDYILPVYKNEYTQLAKLYDEQAPKEQINQQVQAIHDKYFAPYETLYNKLISSGKLYAEKHSIKVNWGVY